MAKALSVSEANQYLIELGYKKNNSYLNIIEDNEFTKKFGTTSYIIKEITNMFDKEHKYRWWDIIGTTFSLSIHEYGDGKSHLGIIMSINGSGSEVVNYGKLKASDKKKFISIFEELVTRKQTYILPQINIEIVNQVWGNSLPEQIVEL